MLSNNSWRLVDFVFCLSILFGLYSSSVRPTSTLNSIDSKLHFICFVSTPFGRYIKESVHFMPNHLQLTTRLSMFIYLAFFVCNLCKSQKGFFQFLIYHNHVDFTVCSFFLSYLVTCCSIYFNSNICSVFLFVIIYLFDWEAIFPWTVCLLSSSLTDCRDVLCLWN